MGSRSPFTPEAPPAFTCVGEVATAMIPPITAATTKLPRTVILFICRLPTKFVVLSGGSLGRRSVVAPLCVGYLRMPKREARLYEGTSGLTLLGFQNRLTGRRHLADNNVIQLATAPLTS